MNPLTKEGARETTKEGRKTIRVVLAEDQGMVLGALAALLEIEGDISVIAQARNGKEALEAVLAHKPDVFITDIEMPHMSGLDVAAELKRRRTGTRVVIVTTFARTGYSAACPRSLEPPDICSKTCAPKNWRTPCAASIRACA